MATSRKAFSMNHPIVVAFLIFAIIAFMYQASSVLEPLALAILVALALTPICRFLERRGLPRVVASLVAVGLALGLIGFVSSRVVAELETLVARVPEYRVSIEKKLHSVWGQGKQGAIHQISQAADDITKSLESHEKTAEGATKVEVVNNRMNVYEQAARIAGPVVESAGLGAFVLILALFIINTREDLGDRITRLFGRSRVSLTTKTTEEVADRISRYLATFSAVNACVGVVVGLGLWAIGLPYAMVWGVLAAMLRFVPYAGPAMAFALPFAFSLAYFDSMNGSLLVIGLFVVLEAIMNSFLEPVIYGKTTGVTALGLLVAAMFWTWLWGPLGLLLSTPLTVCLAVLGKYVPALRVFATFLGEEVPPRPDIRFYQRLLALDQDGALEHVDEVLSKESPATLYDTILIPTLSMIERDSTRDEIDESTRDFAWWMVDEVVQDADSSAPHPPVAAGDEPPASLPADFKIVAVPANDRGDVLSLRMLESLLGADASRVVAYPTGETPLQTVERLAADAPALVVISHLPPGGLTTARYLVRRIRARFATLPILVGRWSEAGNDESTASLTSAGATYVASTLVEARQRIYARAAQNTAAENQDARPTHAAKVGV